jgi:ankyrin repeat protein
MIDLADDLARTPLVVACREGRADAVGTLLKLGANPNCAARPLGLTPCHYAALFGHNDCLRLLIEYRADCDAYTSHLAYFKPIHLAAANGWLQCVEMLCIAGAAPHTPSSHYIILDPGGDQSAGGSLVTRQTQSAQEIAGLQGHSKISDYFSTAEIEGPISSDQAALLAQRRRNEDDQQQSMMDLGTLQGYPNTADTIAPSSADEV